MSLAQDLTGNAYVGLLVISDLDSAVRVHGDRGYRYVHFEAGGIGHLLNVAAEAFGLAARALARFPPQQPEVGSNRTRVMRRIVLRRSCVPSRF